MKCNYHTHSTYCDGKEPMEKFAAKAEELSFIHLGFSSHAPVDFRNDFAIKEEQLPAYIAEIEEIQKKYPKISFFKALECDFIPEISTPFTYFKEKYQLHYIIGGVHLVGKATMSDLWFIDGSKQKVYDDGLEKLYNNNIRKAVTDFWEQTFEMIETEKFDIVAHLDKIKMHNQDRFFKEDEKWYRQLAQHAIELIKKFNLIIEINSRGLYKGRCNAFYPAAFIVAEAAKKDIPFIISSDAHLSSELNLYYPEAVQYLIDNGVQELVYLQDNQWKSYSIFS